MESGVFEVGAECQEPSPGQTRIGVLQLFIVVPVSQLAAHAGVAAFIVLILLYRTLASILILRSLDWVHSQSNSSELCMCHWIPLWATRIRGWQRKNIDFTAIAKCYQRMAVKNHRVAISLDQIGHSAKSDDFGLPSVKAPSLFAVLLVAIESKRLPAAFFSTPKRMG